MKLNYFAINKKMTAHYSRSPDSLRHVGGCYSNAWLLRGKMWMVVLFLLYIWKINYFLSII